MMYKKASKMKLRFATPRGQINVEDLWDLSLGDIDELAKACQRVTESKQTSFITDVEPVDPTAELRFEIVKDVIATRLDELRAREVAANRAGKKQQIMALLAQKQNEELAGSSAEELQAMLDSL